MKARFPCYTTHFSCICTLQEAMKRITGVVLCRHNHLNIVTAYYTGIQKIVLTSHTGEYVYHNSFMPIVNIELAEVVEKTLVTVSFELQKSTKIMMKLFFVLALLLEMTLLILWIMNRLTTLAMLCYPLGLMIFICTLSTIGLYFTSREILGILFEALTCENTKNAPSIHKSNHIE